MVQKSVKINHRLDGAKNPSERMGFFNYLRLHHQWGITGFLKHRPDPATAGKVEELPLLQQLQGMARTVDALMAKTVSATRCRHGGTRSWWMAPRRVSLDFLVLILSFLYLSYICTHTYMHILYIFLMHMQIHVHKSHVHIHKVSPKSEKWSIYIFSVGVLSELFSLSAIGWMEICPADTLLMKI